MGLIVGYMWLCLDLLNWGLVWCGLVVFLLFCVDGFVRVGDDVNCEKVFFVKENMDEFFFFLVKLYIFFWLSLIELLINLVFILVNMMFVEVFRLFIG